MAPRPPDDGRLSFRLEMGNDPENVGVDHGVAYTGHRSSRHAPRVFGTWINGVQMDRYLDPASQPKQKVQNDGWDIDSPLEWLAHVIAHELVHCLQFLVCRFQMRDPHDADFLDLNRVLVGGLGHSWRSV